MARVFIAMVLQHLKPKNEIIFFHWRFI